MSIGKLQTFSQLQITSELQTTFGSSSKSRSRKEVVRPDIPSRRLTQGGIIEWFSLLSKKNSLDFPFFTELFLYYQVGSAT